MNKKKLTIYVIILLLVTSLSSIVSVACCPNCNDDSSNITDKWYEFLEHCNDSFPFDPCAPWEDDTDDDTTDDVDDDIYVVPDTNPSPPTGNKNPITTTSNNPEVTPNQNPIADASKGEPYTGLINTNVTFDGSKSNDPDGEIVEWSWDFGDGNFGTGETVVHSYLKTGTFFVKLKVTDNDGAEGLYQTKVVISYPNRPPTNPLITPNKSVDTEDTDYLFAIASIDPDDDKIQYYIDWGDGTNIKSELLNNGEILSLAHNWASVGTYTIKVTAIDEKDLSSETTQLEVTIKEKAKTSVLNFAILALLVIVLTGCLVAVLEYKRRKK